jgi:hypothetical protein
MKIDNGDGEVRINGLTLAETLDTPGGRVNSLGVHETFAFANRLLKEASEPKHDLDYSRINISDEQDHYDNGMQQISVWCRACGQFHDDIWVMFFEKYHRAT